MNGGTPRRASYDYFRRVDAPALDEGWVRRVLVRRLWYSVGLVALGALVLLSLALILKYYGAASDQLRRHGRQVAGQVLTVREGDRYDDDAATVGYTANGHQLTGEVGLGLTGRHYRVGQTVRVFYDAARPSHLTIDDINNRPPG